MAVLLMAAGGGGSCPAALVGFCLRSSPSLRRWPKAAKMAVSGQVRILPSASKLVDDQWRNLHGLASFVPQGMSATCHTALLDRVTRYSFAQTSPRNRSSAAVVTGLQGWCGPAGLSSGTAGTCGLHVAATRWLSSMESLRAAAHDTTAMQMCR